MEVYLLNSRAKAGRDMSGGVAQRTRAVQHNGCLN